ncbi:hypothetical protein UCRPC4_g02005 [Phaeomoniella chlamydospora]|uniref:DUF3074 domain-containing protein n=1 Tax=Phaeomoniella chlamydospora TaxID=158046 RepID=A0A0G2ESK2_PHACM|nr:hypothetical protein UCRPC4_g02005 [Phaeomoniella chlamydospora]
MSSSSSSSPPLGPLLRLTPLQPIDLPSHPDIKVPLSSSQTQPSLIPFLHTLLHEGLSFSTTFNSPTIFHKHSTKSAPPSSTPVDVLIRSIPHSQISPISSTTSSSPDNSTDQVTRHAPLDPAKHGEYWVARRSYHADSSTAGTASWSEFDFGIRQDHSKHEADFTLTLYDAHPILDWNSSIIHDPVPGFQQITMSIHEMCHSLQFPLKPRCFPVLVITAILSDEPNAFLVITVPVDLSRQPKSFYSSSRNITEGDTKQKTQKPVLGVYSAVEIVRKIPTPPSATAAAAGGNPQQKQQLSNGPGKPGEIEWIMATASDAKGNVPLGIQKLGIPGVVVKDVGYFLKWIEQVRNRGDGIDGRK